MDANGTRYQLLLGEADFGRCVDGDVSLADAWASIGTPTPIDTSLYWDPERNEITLLPLVFAFVPGKDDQAPVLTDRRGAAADRFGNWYFVDPTRTKILVTSSGSETTSVFWPTDDDAPEPPRDGAFGPKDAPVSTTPPTLSGLAVTTHHYLVVGTRNPGGLLIFDLYAGGEPRPLVWPASIPFAPLDMSAAPEGGLWILDGENRRYWALDSTFAVCGRDQATTTITPLVKDPFQPLAAGPVRNTDAVAFPSGLTIDAASPVSAANPISIEALPDGSVLILDRAPSGISFIEQYRFATRLAPPFPVAAMGDLLEVGKTADFFGHDLAFVSAPTSTDPLAGRVLVALSGGNQTIAFAATSAGSVGSAIHLRPLPDFYPMRLFGGRALVSANGQPYYDFVDRFVPLVAQRRPRYRTDATFTTPLDAPFDGHEPGCTWHRLILDGSIPTDASIDVRTRAADDPKSLGETPWSQEPARLHARADGSELPFVSLPKGASSYELLFQRARGRYLQIELHFRGNGRRTPRIRALRAYYPRFSYLKKYMPSTYRVSDTRGFLERFMANIEGVLTPIEDRLAAVQALFDVDAAPSDALEWLAAWFGVAIDPAWDDLRRRLFIRHAMDLFRWRGTTRGLQMAVELVLSDHPCDGIFTRDEDTLASGIRIIERFRARMTPGVLLGDPTDTDFVVPTVAKWTPDLGGSALIASWTAALAALTPPVDSHGIFPVRAPSDGTAATWTTFARATFGFAPQATTTDADAWTQFLYRRYERVSSLNDAWKTTYASFAAVPLFTLLPPDGAPLVDWFQFEGVVLLVSRAAHRFRVLVPVPKGSSADDAEQQRRLELVSRVVDLEKPAHTAFDVKFYWAMFRLGQSRVGYDTLLDRGSRVPELMPNMVLGAAHLLEGHLAPGFPEDATDRDILGNGAFAPRPNA